jgi:FdhD protein
MPRATAVPIVRVDHGAARSDQDLVAIEAPLGVEVRSASGGPVCRLGVLMRTPGDDADLIRGWLYTERVVRDVATIISIDFADPDASEPAEARVTVTLADAVAIDEVIQHRVLTPTSACGLCGRLSVDRVDARRVPVDAALPRWPSTLIASLPTRLRSAQTVFAETGGLHAAGLFDAQGHLRVAREDIGRHNAVDKVIGAVLSTDHVVNHAPLLVVSGRVAFEIVQKAAAAGLAAVIAVGAPSDLAIEAARVAGLTLVGFVRDGRFNVYAGAERIAEDADVSAV